jgi:uncharacterized protein
MHALPSFVRTPTLRGFAFVGVLLLLGGCATSAPAHFYVLTPIEQKPVTLGSELIVGVGPIQLPAYLDQPQMVKRVTPNRLEVNEFERWAGPLQQDVERVLAQNLGRLLGTARVLIYPWEGAVPVDLQVTAEIRRFDAGVSGEVQLDALWTVFQGDGRRLLYMTQSSVSVAALGADFDAIAQAQSAALGELSQAIARELSRLHHRAPGR